MSRYPTVNAASEDKLRARLRNIIFDSYKPNQREIILLTIIQACQMIKDLIPDKKERKSASEKIEILTNDSELQKLLGGAVEEMETLVTLVTTASI